MTVLQRLLKYPHAAVFNKSPEAELALRIRNPHGLVWQVRDSTLSLVTGANLSWDGTQNFDGAYDWGVTRREYSLDGKTIGQLIEEIKADGHDVVFESSELRRMSAHILVASEGDQDASNGDHVKAYTSLLWSLYGAYAVDLERAGGQVNEALRQMVLTQSEGEWLDVWAGLYGVPRLEDEIDPALQARIPEEVFRLRVNGLAIEQTVADLTGEQVTITEPWRRMFTLDESRLSSDHHLQDGRYFTYHVIQPVGGEGTDWSKVMPVIRRNKAAGVDLHEPMVDFGGWHVNLRPPVEYRIDNARTDVRGLGLLSVNDWVLGILTLDVSVPSINHRLSQHHWRTHTSVDGLQAEQVLEPRRNVAFASVCLSDGVALGDENAILSRGGLRVAFDPEPMLSDEMMLSNYTATPIVELVERVALAENRTGVASTFTAIGEIGHTDTTVHLSNEAYPLEIWTGGWNSRRWIPDWRVAGMTMTTESA